MGLLNAVVFESKMPDDIVGWLVKYHNDFGRDGSPYSFQELMKEIPGMEASWKLHCFRQGISSRSCGGGENSYEKKYCRHIQAEFEGKATSWQHFESAKTLVHYLNDVGCSEEFHEWVSDNVDFDNPSLEKGKVIMVLHSFASHMKCNFEKYLTNIELKLAMLEALKFALPAIAPVSKDPESQDPDWLFTDYNTDKMIEWMSYDMSEMTMATAQPKKKKKRTTSANPTSEEPEDMSALMQPLKVKGKAVARQRLFLDDVVMSIRHVVRTLNCAKNNPLLKEMDVEEAEDNRMKKIWPQIFHMCFTLLWTMSVTIQSNKGSKVTFLRCWSSLRSRPFTVNKLMAA